MNIVSAISEQVKIFHKNSHFIYLNNIIWEITPNIYDRVMQLAVSESEARSFEADKERISSFNGTCIHGNSWDDPVIVIFNETHFRRCMDQKDYTWIGTVHHEYSHAVDHRIILSRLQPKSPDEIMNWEYYEPFKSWSEFLARKTGYEQVLRAHAFKNKHANSMTLFQFARANVSCIVDGIKESILSLNLYNLMQYLGKFAVLEELFSGKFNLESSLGSSFPEVTQELLLELFIICQNISRENFEEGLPKLHDFIIANNL